MGTGALAFGLLMFSYQQLRDMFGEGIEKEDGSIEESKIPAIFSSMDNIINPYEETAIFPKWITHFTMRAVTNSKMSPEAYEQLKADTVKYMGGLPTSLVQGSTVSTSKYSSPDLDSFYTTFKERTDLSNIMRVLSDYQDDIDNSEGFEAVNLMREADLFIRYNTMPGSSLLVLDPMKIAYETLLPFGVASPDMKANVAFATERFKKLLITSLALNVWMKNVPEYKRYAYTSYDRQNSAVIYRNQAHIMRSKGMTYQADIAEKAGEYMLRYGKMPYRLTNLLPTK
jgi:hypothetical protein